MEPTTETGTSEAYLSTATGGETTFIPRDSFWWILVIIQYVTQLCLILRFKNLAPPEKHKFSKTLSHAAQYVNSTWINPVKELVLLTEQRLSMSS